MADQFDNPGATTAINLADLKGRLLLLKPSRVETGISTVLGTKDATVVTVHVLDGTDSGQVYTEAFIWPKVLQMQLRPNVGTGRYYLGRLGQGLAKPGQNPPWNLDNPTEDDREKARKYLAGLAAPPITTPDELNGCTF
jgi:hypothetical protein